MPGKKAAIPPVKELPADTTQTAKKNIPFRYFALGGIGILGFALFIYWLAHRVPKPADGTQAGEFTTDAGTTAVFNGPMSTLVPNPPTSSGGGSVPVSTDTDGTLHGSPIIGTVISHPAQGFLGPPLHLPAGGTGSIIHPAVTPQPIVASQFTAQTPTMVASHQNIQANKLDMISAARDIPSTFTRIVPQLISRARRVVYRPVWNGQTARSQASIASHRL